MKKKVSNKRLFWIIASKFGKKRKPSVKSKLSKKFISKRKSSIDDYAVPVMYGNESGWGGTFIKVRAKSASEAEEKLQKHLGQYNKKQSDRQDMCHIDGMRQTQYAKSISNQYEIGDWNL